MHCQAFVICFGESLRRLLTLGVDPALPVTCLWLNLEGGLDPTNIPLCVIIDGLFLILLGYRSYTCTHAYLGTHTPTHMGGEREEIYMVLPMCIFCTMYMPGSQEGPEEVFGLSATVVTVCSDCHVGAGNSIQVLWQNSQSF